MSSNLHWEKYGILPGFHHWHLRIVFSRDMSVIGGPNKSYAITSVAFGLFDYAGIIQKKENNLYSKYFPIY